MLDAVGCTTEILLHPVELVTIEQAADRADVRKTTIDSAAGGTARFRELVLAKSISELRCEPGPETWAALQRGICSGSLHHTLTEILAARSDEIATDPAFALLLSGFDQLDRPRIASAVTGIVRSLAEHFVPFIETGLAAGGEDFEPTLGGDSTFMLLHVLLAESLRRLMKFPNDDEVLHRRLTADAASVLIAELGGNYSTTADWDPYFATVVPCEPAPEGKLGLAVSAGADLLLSGAMPLSTRVTVSDITAATGLNVAAFYRRFGSLAEFERVMLAREAHGLMQAFNDDLFDGLLQSLRSGDIEGDEAVGHFVAAATQAQVRHVEQGRPGHRVVPWFGTKIGREVFSNAFLEVVEQRGEFYDELSSLTGAPMPQGIRGATVAAVLTGHSLISELLIRNAPDRGAGFEVLESRIPLVYSPLFDG